MGFDFKKLVVVVALAVVFPSVALAVALPADASVTTIPVIAKAPIVGVLVLDYQAKNRKKTAGVHVKIVKKGDHITLGAPLSSAKQLPKMYEEIKENADREKFFGAFITKGVDDKEKIAELQEELAIEHQNVNDMRKQTIKNCVVTGVVAAMVGAVIVHVCETHYIKTAARKLYAWLKGRQTKKAELALQMMRSV